MHHPQEPVSAAFSPKHNIPHGETIKNQVNEDNAIAMPKQARFGHLEALKPYNDPL
jgi:hypothetical protein